MRGGSPSRQARAHSSGADRLGLRLSSAVALVAKSRCRNGDFGFGFTAVGTFELPAPARPVLFGLLTPPLRDGCVCTIPCVAEKKLLSSSASTPPGVVSVCARHHDADVDWSDLSVSKSQKKNPTINQKSLWNYINYILWLISYSHELRFLALILMGLDPWVYYIILFFIPLSYYCGTSNF